MRKSDLLLFHKLKKIGESYLRSFSGHLDMVIYRRFRKIQILEITSIQCPRK
jgi:hypothetical protein